MEIDQDYLKRILHYDPETGIFTWKITIERGRMKKGRIAGSIKPNGYRRIVIHRVGYQASRLAWFYMTGEWPKEFVDHINRDKADDRWCNLREATNSQNQANRLGTGKLPKGIYQHKYGFTAHIQRKKLGTYKTVEECLMVLERKGYEIYGEFYLVERK